MRLLALILLPADLLADPITVTENVMQVDPVGGQINITFSVPVYGFNLDAYYFSTFDKGVCLNFSGNYNCLNGLLPSNHVTDPLPPGVTNTDFLFSANAPFPTTSAVLSFMAQSAGDEMDPPHLTFGSFITTGVEQIPTPEPGTFLLAAGAILAVYTHARKYASERKYASGRK